jgi:prepilin-type N-terminal cleavage/methylation domain-containing protein
MRALKTRFRAVLSLEDGFGLIELLISMTMFAIVSAPLAGVLLASITQQKLSKERTLAATQPASDFGVSGLNATVTTRISTWTTRRRPPTGRAPTTSGTFRSYGYDSQLRTSEPNYVGDGSRTSMTFTGSTATYGGGSMSLFGTRVYQYDSSLLYLPPPWFPTLQDAYTIVLSREVAAKP